MAKKKKEKTTGNKEAKPGVKSRLEALEKRFGVFEQTVKEQLQQLSDRQAALLRKGEK